MYDLKKNHTLVNTHNFQIFTKRKEKENTLFISTEIRKTIQIAYEQ